MFANFKKAFINNSISTTMNSELLLNTINKTLPEGFHYQNVGDGIFAMKSDNGCFDFKINRDFIEIEGLSKDEFENAVHSCEELFEYSYNSQREIYFYPTENNQFHINDSFVDASKIVFSVDKKNVDGSCCFVVKPQSFSAPFPLKFSKDNETLDIFVHQVATDSAKVKRFESVDNSPIIVSYEITDITQPINFKFTIKKVKSVKETISSMIIFNSIMDGSVQLFGKPLAESKNNSNSRIAQSNIDFFKKLLELENLLNVEFDATKHISNDDYQKINELYVSLIKNKFILSTEKSIQIKGTAKCQEEIDNYAQVMDNTDYQFEFTAGISITILDVDLKLSSVISLWGGRAVKVEKPSKNEYGEFIIELESTNNSKLYQAIGLFIDDDSASEFRINPEHLKYIRENSVRKEEIN